MPSSSDGTAGPATEPTPGRRERAKLERRRRIEDAAREVFLEKGFEAATTREIAERADVGTGTLFSYARDKRDLLMLIVNDELDEITHAAFATVPKRGPFLTALLHIFAPRYRYWGRDPALSRHAVAETITFVAVAGETPPKSESARFYARQWYIVDKLAELIAHRQRSAGIAIRVKPRVAAILLMDIYLSEVQNWLGRSEHPEVTEGIERLSEILSLALNGLGPER